MRTLIVNVIGKRRVEEFQKLHSDASDELRRWYAVSSKATWKHLIDLRQDFQDADQIGKLVVFNIRHNTYRLIAKVDFKSGLVMVKGLLTHKEYNRKAWKQWT